MSRPVDDLLRSCFARGCYLSDDYQVKSLDAHRRAFTTKHHSLSYPPVSFPNDLGVYQRKPGADEAEQQVSSEIPDPVELT